MNDPASDELHLQILRLIEIRPELTPRELSEHLGVSYGKTDFVIRALVRKGYLKAKRFKASSRKSAYLYLLTPAGLEAKARITARFLRNKIGEYDALRQEIDFLSREAGQEPVGIYEQFRQLFYHAGIRRYAANMGWLMAEQVGRLVSGLVVGIWVARYLGPHRFGLLSYCLAFTLIFAGIARLGLEALVIRGLVQNPERRNILLGTAFWLKFAASFLMIGVVGLATLLTSNDQTTNLYIIIIASASIFQSFEVVDFYFQSKVLSKHVTSARMVQLAVSSGLKVFLILTNAELLWFVIVALVDQVSLAFSYLWAYGGQRIGFFFGCFDLSAAKRLLSDSWPLMFSGLVVMIYMRIDQVMLKEMMDEHAVGIYSAAVRLSEVWYFIPGIVTSSLFPAILNARMSDPAQYRRRLQRLYTVLVWMAIGIALPVTLLHNWIIYVVYGEAYREAGPILMVHIWTGIFVFLGVVFERYLVSENYGRRSLYRTMFGASVNVGLNLLLIPVFGALGAALATLAGQASANLIYDFFDRRVHGQLMMKLRAIFLPLSLFASLK